MVLEIIPIKIQEEIANGVNLVPLILESSEINDGDILVFSQKIVSKNEGRMLSLSSVNPSLLANGIASSYGKDPRLIELILSESERIVRMENGIIIVKTKHGFVCANAGIDESNVQDGYATLLPKDPDKSAILLKERIASIDTLINNVGIAGPTGPMESLSISDWRNTIDINLNSHFYFTKHSIPLLKNNKGGSIINISSTAGLFGFPLRTPYVASKWAVIGVTKSLAMELGEFNIRVNAICPGSVSGDRMERVIEAKAKSTGISEEELQKDYESMVSLKTFVSKEDIANMALFLLSNEAHKISGQVMTVDGNTERMT